MKLLRSSLNVEIIKFLIWVLQNVSKVSNEFDGLSKDKRSEIPI